MEMKTLPSYVVKVPFHHHRKGDVIQPTGIWRDRLIQIGFIERLREQPVLTVPRAVRRKATSNA